MLVDQLANSDVLSPIPTFEIVLNRFNVNIPHGVLYSSSETSALLSESSDSDVQFVDLDVFSDATAASSNSISTLAQNNTRSNVLNIEDAVTGTTSLFEPEQFSLDIPEAIAPNDLDDPVEFGDPDTEGLYWRQQDGDQSCAVVAQISIYEALTGVYISEEDACNFAESQGWFDPLTGTPVGYVGYVLDSLGVNTYEQNYATLGVLQTALAQGDKPIVALDAHEIWVPQYDAVGNPLELTNAGHAVWVTGINYRQDGSISLILNDSGIPTGSSSEVDYGDFMNAWQDYDYFVSIADNPFA